MLQQCFPYGKYLRWTILTALFPAGILWSCFSQQCFFPQSLGWRWKNRERELPFDQHFLLAAIAPRLLYITSGTRDDYADPQGEYLAARAASKAWTLFGSKGLPDTGFPQPGRLIGHAVGYHLQEGGHDCISQETWNVLLEFAEKHFHSDR